MAVLLLQTGGRLLLQPGGRLLIQEPPPGPVLWAREPGRFLTAPEPGRFLWAREPGRFLTMAADAQATDFIGTFKLERGGTAGGRRRLGVHLANREEIAAGDTLSGAPTAVVEGGGVLPTVSSPAYSGTDLLFTAAAGSAPAGKYVVRFHAETSGGGIYEPWAYLKLEDSRT